MAHDVFVSYSSKDKPTADAVCAGLEAASIRCWMAPRDILPGQQWASAIVEAIHDSKLMIVVLSINSNASEQVLREVERSVHHAIPIIPFRIEEFELASSLEYYLSVPHWLDAMTGPMEDHIHRLVQTAQALLATRRPAPSRTPSAAAPAHTIDIPPEEQARDDALFVEAVRELSGEIDVPDLPPPVAASTSARAAASSAPAAAATAPAAETAPSLQAASPAASADGARPATIAAPAQRGLPPWIWAIPMAVVVLAAAIFAITRLLPAGDTTGRGDGGPATAVAVVPSIDAAPPPTIAPPATQPPQVAAARVNVTSSVDGATILLNGQVAGRTPQTLSLQPGPYELKLQAATYRDWSQALDVSEGEQVPVQAILEPLPPTDVLEVTERVMGKDAVRDSGDIVRVRTPTDTFLVSDVINAVVYFNAKTRNVRDISYNVTHRWQIAGDPQPGVVSATQRTSRDDVLPFTHACAPAALLDSRGSNTPLTLEILIDGESVGRFTFRVAGGNLADAPRDPVAACDKSRLPSIVVTLPDSLAADDTL